MKKIQDQLNRIMEKMKKQNPNANWANLLTGVAVLAMVAVFSYAYFTKSKGGNVVIDDSKLVEEVTKENKTNETTGDTVPDTSAEPGEKGATPVGETTIVQKGEGLWHVAQRVCGDGEKYNILANANGLNVWEELNEGMTLKVVCK
ncbi:MAG: hypothetical protein WC988_03375 [Patescibacteria group bacterium]